MFVQLWNSFPEELTTKQKIIYTNVTEDLFVRKESYIKLSTLPSRKVLKVSITQPAITCSKLTIETLEQGVKLFKVNIKDTRTTPLASFWYLYY